MGWINVLLSLKDAVTTEQMYGRKQVGLDNNSMKEGTDF